MKIIQILTSLILITLTLNAYTPDTPQLADDILGTYWTPKKDGKIEIFKRGNKYFGKFTWLAAPRKDVKNSAKSQRSKDVVGLEFLTGFRYDDGIYKDGEIYDPENGKTYSCKIVLEQNKLKVRGYVGISLLGRTEVFERIK